VEETQMNGHAEGTFEVTSWDEAPYVEIDDARKLTRASVTQRFTGDLQGDGAVEWLMCYRTDGTADWLGMERVVGTLAGRQGSFVLQMTGTFDGTAARGDWHVVDGSGTDGLEGLTGQGAMEAPLGSTATFVLDYAVE
jgi:hypothetical protein